MRLTHFALNELTLLAAFEAHQKTEAPLERFKKRIPEELSTALAQESNARCSGLKQLVMQINAGQSEIIVPATLDWDMSRSHEEWERLNAMYGYFPKEQESLFELFKQVASPLRTMAVLFEPNHFARDEIAYEYAYKLMALFVDPADKKTQTLDAVAAATDNLLVKRDKNTTSPLHDLLLDLRLPVPGQIDRQGWQALLKKEGAQALPFLNEAQKIEDKNGGKAPSSLKDARRLQLLCQYTRANEDTAFAATCRDFKVSEDSFNQSLDFIKSGWPKKTTDSIPSLEIKGTDQAEGYCWVKLPPDDKRALILGRITGCCQSIGDHSDRCVRDAVTRPFNGLYVLLKQRKAGAAGQDAPPLVDGKINDAQFEIVGQSYVWSSRSGNLCLDSIECSQGRVPPEVLEKIITDFAEELLKQTPTIHRVTVGQGGGTPSGLFAPVAIPEAMLEGYQYGDSQQQYLIAKKNTLSEAQRAELEAILQGKAPEFTDCILYLIEQADDRDGFNRALPDLLQEKPAIETELTKASLQRLFFNGHKPTLDTLKPVSFDTESIGAIPAARLLFRVKSSEELIAVLPYIREEERFAAVQEKNTFGETVLHTAARNPESLRTILSLLPESDRLASVQEKNTFGDTVLHAADGNPESLRTILLLYPESDRLAAVQEKNSYRETVLHTAAGNPESLRVILSLYPEGDRLAAVQEENTSNETILHIEAGNPESLRTILSLLPESDRLAAVQEKNIYRETVLHTAASNSESLGTILSLYRENERLAAVQEQDIFGQTVLHNVANNPESLKIIFNKLPTLDFLIAARDVPQSPHTLAALKEKLEELTEDTALKSDIRAATTHQALLPLIQKLQAESGRAVMNWYKAEQPREEKPELPRKPSR